MSVEIYNISENPWEASELCIGVSSEYAFHLYWEQALLELKIDSLGNGIWLYRAEKEKLFADFRNVREWAVEMLPDTRLWMG